MRIQYLKFKFFLEGIEIKQAASFTVQYSEDTPGSCQVNIHKLAGMEYILPGTIGQLFIKDETSNFGWVLAFEGSLVSKSYSSGTSSEAGTLSFSGLSSTLDTSRLSTSDFSKAGSVQDKAATDLIYVNDLGKISETKQHLLINPATQDGGFIHNLLIDWENKSVSGLFSDLFAGLKSCIPYVSIMDTAHSIFGKTFIKYSNSSKIKSIITALGSMLKTQNSLAVNTRDTSVSSLIKTIASLFYMKYIRGQIPGKINNKIITNNIIPDPSLAIPPIFNIIDVHDYESFQLTITHKAEPTRFILTGLSLNFFKDMIGTGVSVLPTYLSPAIDADYTTNSSGQTAYRIGFTDEEKYRGVTVKTEVGQPVEQTRAMLSRVSKGEKMDTDEDKKKLAEKYLTQNSFNDSVRSITDYNFIKSRLAARGMGQITVKFYNPSWLVGFPGVIVTKDLGAARVLFKNITLSGHSNGSLQCTIEFSEPIFQNETILVNGKQESIFDFIQHCWPEYINYSDTAPAKCNELYSAMKCPNDKNTSFDIVSYRNSKISPPLKPAKLNFSSIKTALSWIKEQSAAGTLDYNSFNRNPATIAESDYFSYLSSDCSVIGSKIKYRDSTKYKPTNPSSWKNHKNIPFDLTRKSGVERYIAAV